MTTPSTRPSWTHKVPYDFAKWLSRNNVKKITHHWEFTGVDTSIDWIELHSETESRKCPVSLGGYQRSNDVLFQPDHRTLVTLADHVAKTISEIEEWEKKESRDIADYKRLHKKLFGTEATISQ